MQRGDYILYLKEFENIDEMFEKNSKKPFIIKKIILYIKRIFCILTIRENNLCILPYKKVKNIKLIKIITKILEKNTTQVALSKKLEKNEILKQELENSKIKIFNGRTLLKYMIYDCVEYISKIRKQNIQGQEITLLCNKLDELNKNIIINLCNKVKRVNIVTNNINKFKRIDNYLESIGIPITITNNKRKSLLNSKIVINIDFEEELINLYKINRNAIIININEKINIYSKSFIGININDYIINIGNMDIDSIIINNFDIKIILEARISANDNFIEILELIKEYDVNIVGLIGKNGIIQDEEYIRN